MEGKKLEVGIAGYGVVGKKRRHFIDQHPKLNTVAVCDQSFKESGIMDDGVRFLTNYKNLIEEPLDILFVCLPNYLAPEVTIAGFERGLHVFCEKPPGRDVHDIKKVIAAERKHPGLLLKYGFNHRYHDSVAEALRIIQSREMGEIINMRGVYGKSKIHPIDGEWRGERRYSGGGILLDQGIHMVDLMLLFCGDFPEVKCFVSNSYWGGSVEDNVYALMRDKHGRIAMLHSSSTQWQHCFNLIITLTEGCLELQGILTGSTSYGQEKLIIVRRDESDVGTQCDETRTYLADNSWSCEINEFADAVINGRTIKYGTSEDALAAMNLVYRIYNADPVWKEAYDIPNPDETS